MQLLNKGIWVIDRGGDRDKLYESLLLKRRNFIIRLVGTRDFLYQGNNMKRWGIEETIQFVKQTYDLTYIKVLKYVRLQNMMALLLAVFYFIAVILDQNQKLTIMAGHILKSAKRVFGIPDFKYYALGDGLSKIFLQYPGKLMRPVEIFDSQLKFGFG